MDREQKHQEKHRLEREEKQADERESEKWFSKPGVTIHPLWFWALGVVLTLVALFVWMRV